MKIRVALCCMSAVRQTITRHDGDPMRSAPPALFALLYHYGAVSFESISKAQRVIGLLTQSTALLLHDSNGAHFGFARSMTSVLLLH